MMAQGEGFSTKFHVLGGLRGQMLLAEKYQTFYFNYSVEVNGKKISEVCIPLTVMDAVEFNSLLKFMNNAIKKEFPIVVRGETHMLLEEGQMPVFTFHRAGGTQIAVNPDDIPLIMQEIKNFLLQGDLENFHLYAVERFRDDNAAGRRS